ncbi:MAG: D-alanyl-D-alanine carboxypeptidase/D-alanyl-D-alanine-endopeptidase (penicillin-binding protein 4) [Woeseiaceae bacterium]|jgi:D-alanyl-D-alanine carboxypeptidase/D-alanyl-D-alanine-endopeptidase (penicillin-binding protein 4)
MKHEHNFSRSRVSSTIMTAISLVLSATLVSAQTSLPLPVQSALNYRSVPHETLSIYVEDLTSGDVVLSWNDTVPRNPASVEKMLTTLVALDTLGPTYTWKTDVHVLGEVEQGVLEGDLLLKGYGDPYLVTERFWQLLRQIRQSGITSINGDLLIDDSYFNVGNYDPAAFDREPLRAYNVAPNALLTNFKVVRFYFEPNKDATGVNVIPEPQLQNLELVNRLRVVNGACRGYQRGITITPNEAVSEITFSGNFPGGCDYYRMDRAALGHNAYTFGLFTSLWREGSGDITGSWKNSVMIDDAEPWFSFESLPLTDIITKVNKHSNNVMARQLLYTLGAENYGPPGTEEKGRQFVMEWLDKNDMDAAELSLGNGAGLSRNSRMTARHLGNLLHFAYRQPYMPEYLSSLSLAGLDGTLSRRFRNGSLTGMAHIKTGSLDHVSAFAGYFQSRSGNRFVVVTLQNHEDVHRGPGKEVQEALLQWLYEK